MHIQAKKMDSLRWTFVAITALTLLYNCSSFWWTVFVASGSLYVAYWTFLALFYVPQNPFAVDNRYGAVLYIGGGAKRYMHYMRKRSMYYMPYMRKRYMLKRYMYHM